MAQKGDNFKEKSGKISNELGIGTLLSEVMVSRGFENAQQVKGFLEKEESLGNPFDIQDMGKAVDAINEAMENDEYIVVFGDYDVDGITATALLYSYLENSGASAFYKISSRSDDGYGLSPAIVDQIADKGISMIITVDNGTSSIEAVERANERGVKVVISDHHIAPEILPDATAIVNPCREENSPYARLSGVGVAFMLVAALEGCTPEELLPMFGDLAAIGTIADVMKLEGVNRTIVKAGLSFIQHSQRPGLVALMENCGFAGKEVNVENVSYGLAPRLNAAGRMDDATVALELLLTEDEEEALELAQNLQEQNTIRQQTEQDIMAEISAMIENNPEIKRESVLIVAGEGWHQGVIGIVSSRLMERYSKPSIVISIEDGEGRGSGRSIAGFSLYAAIASCKDILIRFGGHDLAAGLSIEAEKIDEFRQRVNLWAKENIIEIEAPKAFADIETDLLALKLENVKELDKLAPFGSGNPQPKFYVQDVLIEAVYPLSEGRHARLKLSKGGTSVLAVIFRSSPEELAYKPGDEVDIILSVSIYEGRQNEQVSARIEEMRPYGISNKHVEQNRIFKKFISGRNIKSEEKTGLYPTRDDTARVYRFLRDYFPVNYIDLRPVFAKLGEESAGKILVSLNVLEELGLIKRNEEKLCFELIKVTEKKDLGNSDLLKRLAETGSL